MAGTSVTKTVKLFGVASAVSKEMAAFEKEETPSQKQNSGKKRKLSDKDYRTLTQIVRKDHKNTVPKITARLNDHFENPASLKTVKRPLHKAGFHGRAAIRKQ